MFLLAAHINILIINSLYVKLPNDIDVITYNILRIK